MNMEDAESELGIEMAITKSGEKSNWQVNFTQVSGIIIIALIGVFLQEVFRFGNGVIL